VRWFSNGEVVPGARSTLVRLSGGVQMRMHTSGLTSDDAVTVWWIIFNNPSACTHDVDGGGALRCSAADLLLFGGDPAVSSSIVFAAGHVVGVNRVSFAGALGVDDTSAALFGPGLTNPDGAEIHLLVRDHGPMAGAAQIRSFDACNPTCANLQFSAHPAG
jgi:hypothetical protein